MVVQDIDRSLKGFSALDGCRAVVVYSLPEFCGGEIFLVRGVIEHNDENGFFVIDNSAKFLNGRERIVNYVSHSLKPIVTLD